MLAACATLGVSTPVAAQSTSAAAVQELASLLDRRGLDGIAARVPGTEDTFVAALYVPGQQLIVVSGRYAAPALLREKILSKRYREAYVDLYGASDPATRQVFEDVRADGLKPVREKDAPFDLYTGPRGELIPFDGDWKRRKLSEAAYQDAFEKADRAYAAMAAVLVSELKGAREPIGPPTPTAQATLPIR